MRRPHQALKRNFLPFKWIKYYFIIFWSINIDQKLYSGINLNQETSSQRLYYQNFDGCGLLTKWCGLLTKWCGSPLFVILQWCGFPKYMDAGPPNTWMRPPLRMMRPPHQNDAVSSSELRSLLLMMIHQLIVFYFSSVWILFIPYTTKLIVSIVFKKDFG